MFITYAFIIGRKYVPDMSEMKKKYEQNCSQLILRWMCGYFGD